MNYRSRLIASLSIVCEPINASVIQLRRNTTLYLEFFDLSMMSSAICIVGQVIDAKHISYMFMLVEIVWKILTVIDRV